MLEAIHKKGKLFKKSETNTAFRLVLLLLSFVILSGPSLLKGQTTFGAIRGTVRDSASAVIVNAKVTVTNEATNISRETTTDETGRYEVTHLNPGHYTVTVESPGFQRFVNQNILVETAQVLRIDVLMQLGQVTETVTVLGEAPIIDTETTTISDVRTGRQMLELPLNITRGNAFGGGIFRYLNLSPGSFRYEGASRHSFGGTRGTQANFMMDGTQLGDQNGGQITPMQPSFESVQEIKLMMVNNSAEYTGVATIAVTSKSGSNEFHGSAFHQYNSGSLNARNFFATSSPWRVYNQFGGGFGGPIVRDRTFFFLAYEGNRNHTQSVFNSSVPSVAIRQGDFSQVFDRQGRLVAVRDFTTGEQFPNNVIPASRFSEIPVTVQERFFPLPNFGPPTQLQQNLRAQVVNAPSWDHVDIRLDHKLHDKNSLFARYTGRNMPTPVPEGQLPDTGLRSQLRRIRNWSFVDTHTFSPSIINELRIGNAWHANPREGPRRGLQIVRELGIQGLTEPIDIGGVPEFRVTGFSQITQIAFNEPEHEVYDFSNNVTFATGRHTLKVGFNHRRNRTFNRPVPNDIFGRYDFTGTFTGFAYSDFLLGVPQRTFRTTPQAGREGRNQVYAGFIQDDYKVHPNLTLNLGLRYEWMNPFHEVDDRMFNFDESTGNIVVPTQTVLQRDISPIFPASIGIVTADEAGFPRRGLRKADNSVFGPRLGVAWRPFGHARSVVRAGFGLFHNTLSGASFGPLSSGGPFVTSEQFVNRVRSGVPDFQFPEPFGEVGSLGTISVSGVRPDIVQPYTLQSNLTVEQEYLQTAFRLSYLSTRSVKLLYRRNISQPFPSTEPFDVSRRPFPQFRNVTMADNGAISQYHALQFEAERKFTRGLSYQIGYTWAKQLAHGQDSGELGTVIQNAFDRDADWGDDLFLMRHRMVANFIWEIPVGAGRRWLVSGPLSHVLGGWNLTNITLLQTGQRFTPTYQGADPANVDVTTGRPDRIGDGNLPRGERTIDRWFDASAFVVPPGNAGRFGNSAIGVLAGPGTNVFSFGLFKNIVVKERMRIEFSVNTTNAFNHPNFRNPNSNITAVSQVGRITSTQGQDESGARTIVLGTRIDF